WCWGWLRAARRAVEAAELYADGALTGAALGAAREAVALECGHLAVPAGAPATAAGPAADGAEGGCMWACLAAAQHAAECGIDMAEEARAEADIVRDLFGPPPFDATPVAPGVLAWQGQLVPKLAEAAYRRRSRPSGTLDGDALAVLADAVEEAGG